MAKPEGLTQRFQKLKVQKWKKWRQNIKGTPVCPVCPAVKQHGGKKGKDAVRQAKQFGHLSIDIAFNIWFSQGGAVIYS